MKALIVLETYRDGVSVAEIARKHDISSAQLHGWRRAARDALMPMPEDDGLAFLPVSVTEGDHAGCDDGGAALTSESGDVRLFVPPAFDADHLAPLITALRSAS